MYSGGWIKSCVVYSFPFFDFVFPLYPITIQFIFISFSFPRVSSIYRFPYLSERSFHCSFFNCWNVFATIFFSYVFSFFYGLQFNGYFLIFQDSFNPKSFKFATIRFLYFFSRSLIQFFIKFA